jgi:hypothetical protein
MAHPEIQPPGDTMPLCPNPDCKKPNPEESQFCIFCGNEMPQPADQRLPVSGRVQKFSFFQMNKDRIALLSTILLVILVIVIAIILSVPHDEYIQIGNATYLLSTDAQQYLTIADRSYYPATRSFLIINEPHMELDQQYNLYQGLATFFKGNPELAKNTIFLAEGYPSGEFIQVQPLLEADPSPSDDLIRSVLATYLIPGYIAYVWKYQNAIPIAGSENDTLYMLSARQYMEGQDDYWSYTVLARNQQMVQTLMSMEKTCQNPVLFVGGLHLSSMDSESFSSVNSQIMSYAGSDAVYFKNIQNKGIADYLEEKNIGYTFLSARNDLSVNQTTHEKWNENYRELFTAQQEDDYPFYITSLAVQQYYRFGVTVSPSTYHAAGFVQVLKKIINWFKGQGDDGFYAAKGSKPKEGDFVDPKRDGEIVGIRADRTHSHGQFQNHLHIERLHVNPQDGWKWSIEDSEVHPL